MRLRYGTSLGRDDFRGQAFTKRADPSREMSHKELDMKNEFQFGFVAPTHGSSHQIPSSSGSRTSELAISRLSAVRTHRWARLVRELAPQGVKVPDGFAITAEAFRHFIREAELEQHIRSTLSDLNTRDRPT